MMNLHKRLFPVLVALLLLVGAYFVIASLTHRTTANTPSANLEPAPSEETSSRTYTDIALHFSIEKPARVTILEKMGQAIYFKESVNHSIIVVIAEPTPYETTEAWLADQPKGSASSTGFELIRWIGDQTNGKALVAEYAGPGTDGTYGKRLRMMTVKNKSIYTVDVDTWHKADAALTVDPDIEQALKTFHATGLVTTDSTGSYRTIQNWECGATFHIPPNWVDQGILGESNILSPEDVQKNADWDKAHQDLLAKEEGDAPLGPDARSLYLSCQYDFKEIDLKAKAIKTMKINGRDAYELTDTNSATSITTYQLILEGPKMMDIELGQTEYDKLSDAVKQIIQSISFEK